MKDPKRRTLDEETEQMIQSPQCDILDIFPERVPASTVWYWDVEQYFLKTEFQNYLKKCFRILLKFICYYPYTVVQCEFPQPVPGTDIYQTMEKTYCEIPPEKMKWLLLDTMKRNGCFSVYFRGIPLLFVVDSDSFSTTVYGLEPSSEPSRLLSELVRQEGLFLRHCPQQSE